eukprot:Skav205735  [mRNA]  locus=scaffold1496:184368:185621:+ [translate_table: standard]
MDVSFVATPATLTQALSSRSRPTPAQGRQGYSQQQTWHGAMALGVGVAATFARRQSRAWACKAVAARPPSRPAVGDLMVKPVDSKAGPT